MTSKLFDIKQTDNGVDIFPSQHCYTISYLRDIIEEYGEINAGKIFTYFHYMWSMNPDENPFYNVPEEEKKEIIARNVVPANIDIDDPLIEEGLELVGKLYETPNYRLYKGYKRAKDKLATALNFVHISLDREDGNTKEIENAAKLEATLNERTKAAFKEMMDEMGVTEARGGRTRNKYSGKSEELD